MWGFAASYHSKLNMFTKQDILDPLAVEDLIMKIIVSAQDILQVKKLRARESYSIVNPLFENV